MNILITGSKGYIGKSLINSLNNEFNIIGISNGMEYSFSNSLIYLDLLNKEHLEQFLKEDIEIDIIIHIASKMASSNNINDMSLFYDNVKMYENIVLMAKHFKPSKLINFSSIAVYPNISGEYNEMSLINPSVNNDALYGLSKFCGENIVDHLLKETSVKTVHLRVSQVYSDDMREDRLYPMMKKELKEENQITVYGNGERVSNFIHKDKLIQKVVLFIKNDIYGIFNIGKDNLSYNDFARDVINKFGNNESKIISIDKGLKEKVYINVDKLNNLER